MVTATVDRVRANTPPGANARIQQRMIRDLAFFEAHPEHIEDRLQELDREWDIERVLGTGSSTLSLAGLALAMTRSRRWIVLPLVVQGFFLMHAIQGWCPPLPVLRKLGMRTEQEIEHERGALKEIAQRWGESQRGGRRRVGADEDE